MKAWLCEQRSVRRLSASSAITFDSTSGTPTLDLNGSSQAIQALNSFQNGAGAIALGSGTLTVGSGSFSGSFSGSGTLTKSGPATLTIGQSLRGQNLEVIGGTLAVGKSTPTAVNTVASLMISGGKLDLGNSTFSIDSGSAAGVDGMVRGYLASGYDNGKWDGNGIVTSAGTGLGFADGADGIVPGLAHGVLRIQPAIPGDANLDGHVNFSDLLLLAQHYGSADATWDQGDFDYNGAVGFSDLLKLAQNYGLATLMEFRAVG